MKPAMLLVLTWIGSSCWAFAGPFVTGVGTHGCVHKDLAQIEASGLVSVRTDIHWAQVETTKGVLTMPPVYDSYVKALLKHHLQPLIILDYGNPFYDGGGYPVSEESVQAFANFASFVAQHFKGQISAYEIWNEWDDGAGIPFLGGPGDPNAYVHLLQETYQQIKLNDPEVTVIGGVVAGSGDQNNWLQLACQDGLLSYLDAFSFHPYCFENIGSHIPEIGLISQVTTVQKILQPYTNGRAIPLYITEFGWPTNTGLHGFPAQQVAKYDARALLLGRKIPALQGMWLYDWINDGLDTSSVGDNFGIVQADSQPKPALPVLQDLQLNMRGAIYLNDRQTDSTHDVERFRTAGRHDLLVALWQTQGSGTVQVSVQSQDMPANANVHKLGQKESTLEWQQTGVTTWTVTLRSGPMPSLVHLAADDCDVAWQ